MWISVVELFRLSLLTTLVHKVQSLISYHPFNGFNYILWFGSWCFKCLFSLYLPRGLSNAHTTSWLGLIDGFGTNCKPLRKREQAQSTLYKELQKIAHSLIHGIVPCTLPSTLVLSLAWSETHVSLFPHCRSKLQGFGSLLRQKPTNELPPMSIHLQPFSCSFLLQEAYLNPSICNRASVAEGHSDPSQLAKSVVVVRGKFRSFNLQLLLQERHSNASTCKEGLLQPEF